MSLWRKAELVLWLTFGLVRLQNPYGTKITFYCSFNVLVKFTIAFHIFWNCYIILSEHQPLRVNVLITTRSIIFNHSPTRILPHSYYTLLWRTKTDINKESFQISILPTLTFPYILLQLHTQTIYFISFKHISDP